MKSLLSMFCTSLAVLATSPPIVSAAPPQAPDVVYMAAGPRTEPIWVAAEAAATPTKELNWGLFTPSEAETLGGVISKQRREATAKSSSECATVFGAPVVERVNPKPNQSFKDLKTHAIGAYSGRVVNVTQGFFDGLPSSLLQVQVENRLRAANSVHQDELWVVYPYARFQVGDVKFCTGVASMDRPEIGDRILVFLYNPPLDAGRKLVVPEPQEIIFQKSQGGLRLPRELEGDAELGTARTLSQIERSLAAEFRPQPDRRHEG
jgi:hypothetical protein